MKNKLTDLNDHLFAQIERMGDESLTDEQVDKESKRSQAIIGIADKIINNADLHLRAIKMSSEYGSMSGVSFPMLEPKN